MQQLHGTIQHYAWGTHDAIPSLLGREPDGRPHAEYWLGAHPASPSTTDAAALDALIRSDLSLLGERVHDTFGPILPFLMKVLSARHALSIQAHPSREQAQEGFARENAARIPVESPERVYSDDWPKPEVLIALDEFETLSGFRDPLTTAALFSGWAWRTTSRPSSVRSPNAREPPHSLRCSWTPSAWRAHVRT
ncbi:MAG: mannose-6-phosphate isomerase, class I [Micropruina sp.]|nr:mannose-6-phosphate isomerase, class I [Micropruina sp.]